MHTRTETDTFGAIEVPAERLWGAQTQRSLHFFAVSTERMPWPVIAALVQIKRAAAKVNVKLAGLSAEKANAIVVAADEVLCGRWPEEFPLSVWQTGSGTQTHMNVNEVLANRASELLGGPRGADRLVHPNDDVNRSQSSNDVFPTAMHLSTASALRDEVLPSVRALMAAFEAKRIRFERLVKLGRTHLMDATPLTLGQELSGWGDQLAQGLAAIDESLGGLFGLAIGGTAVGTSLNAPRGFGEAMCEALATATSLPVRPATNRFAALGGLDALVRAHGALKQLATACFKIASDLRLLASGPRAGLGELQLPENEPGSSIMPGKVNPTQVEMLTQVCAQVTGNDVVVSLAAATGQLQLNVMRPLVISNLLQSARLLSGGCDGFRRHLVEGLEANEARLTELLDRSLMLVTALAPHVGYDLAARIAKQAHDEGTSLREAALALGVTDADFDRWVDPRRMV